MEWTEPKTNWTKDDRINMRDYNRIKNNQACLRDMAAGLYPAFEIPVDPDKTDYGGWPYASEVNRLEENLEAIRSHTHPFPTGEAREYYDNAPTIDWWELNRLEAASQLIHDGLQGQADGKRRLAFRLGGISGGMN